MSRIAKRLAIALLGVTAAVVFSSCGGGSSNSSSPPASSGNCNTQVGTATSVGTPNGTNVASMIIDGGPTVNGASLGTVNQGYVTVILCAPGSTSNCRSIDHIWVDTGSSGLRLFCSPFTQNLPTLQQGGNPVGNCAQFVSTYTWGAVRATDVYIAGERASSVPVQVIGDTAVPATAPTTCSSGATAMNTVADMGANGLLGIGLFQEDCGSGCATTAFAGFYYTCPAGTCSSVAVATAQQLQNIVGLFTTDNNGNLIQLPALTAAGAPTATGSLIFGINTQTNNQLASAVGGSAVVFQADPNSGTINTTTTYGNGSNSASYIDSGSNGWFFYDPSLVTCSGSSGFFCSNATLMATMSSCNTNTTSCPASPTSFTYTFNIASFTSLSTSNTAFNNLGGPSPPPPATFDWGLPFFYGRSVFTALENTVIAGNNGPFFAASPVVGP
jgi:uncharacterized protein DUF3443